MKPFRITIKPSQGPAWSYTGLFSDSCTATSDAIERTWGQRVRISARVLR